MNEDHDKFDAMDQKIKDASTKLGVEIAPPETPEEGSEDVMNATASAGVEFAAAILICTFFGGWLDKKFDTAPIWMFLFLILGGAVGFYNLYRASENLDDSSSE